MSFVYIAIAASGCYNAVSALALVSWQLNSERVFIMTKWYDYSDPRDYDLPQYFKASEIPAGHNFSGAVMKFAGNQKWTIGINFHPQPGYNLECAWVEEVESLADGKRFVEEWTPDAETLEWIASNA
jgi:hypothetical protein